MSVTSVYARPAAGATDAGEAYQPFWKFLDGPNALRRMRAFAALTLPMLAVAAYMAVFYAPREATMGDAQRIFYFHVPSAWVGFLAFGVVFVSSILYLAKRDDRWDMLAHASAEVGIVFTSLVLLTGPIWAKAAWGAYWVWDARLTMTLVLWIMYVGYLMLRAATSSRRIARLAAVTGIVGCVNIPLIYVSVIWWRTMHPTLVVTESGGLDPAMLQTLMVALAAFTLLYAWLLLARLRLGQLRWQLAAHLAARGS